MANENQGYGKRPLWQWLLLYLVIAGLAYAGFYYFFLKKGSSYNLSSNQTPSYQTQGTSRVTTTPTPSPSVSVSVSPSAAVSKITIIGTEFAFTPSTFTVKEGEPVTVTFMNNGTYPHNFTISGLNVKTPTIQPGEKTVLTFTPMKTGTFTFVCTVPGHADKGMTGKITVE